jgi:protein SCO1/2
MSLKTIQVALWALAAAAAIALPIAYLSQTPVTQRSSGVATVGGPFVLTAANGQPFDSKSLVGKPYALFFGFTHCPDVCPTTTAEMTGFLGELGDKAKDFRVLFVTVDPARDTPEALKDFLSSFDPRIVGLSGSQEKIDAVVRAYGAVATRVDLDGGNYTMDHTASVFLFGADGRLVSTLDYKENPTVKLQKIKNLLGV